MDEHQFDAALRALHAGTTRRAGLAGALGVLLGGRTGALAGDAARGRADASRAQAAPESGGWHYQSQFGRGCGSTTRYCLTGPGGMSISADGTVAYVFDSRSADDSAIAAARVAVYVRNPGSTTWYYSHAFGNICGSNPRNSHFCLGADASGLSVSADGTRAYVADTSNSRIAVYSRNPGSTTWYYSHAFGNGSLSDLLSIAVSGDELTAWVADTRKHRILIWTRPSTSSTTWSFSTQFGWPGSSNDNFSYPAGIAVSADTLTTWVADSNNSRIAIWTRPSTSSKTWSYRDSFGTRGEGDSNFRSPKGIAVSADTLTVWVADTGNNRIAVWDRPDKDSTDWSPSAQFSGFGTGASALKHPFNVAVTPDGLTALVSGNRDWRFSAGVVETWTKS